MRSASRSAVARAKQRATETDQPYMVCIVDHHDDRIESVEPYANAEFFVDYAFDGEVVAVIYPNGDVD